MFASCQNEGDSARDDAAAAAAGKPVATTTPPPPTAPSVKPGANAAKPAPPVGPTTTLNFAETEFNFGKIKSGEKVEHVYKFKNTGKEPLVISNAKGSCGCTVPQWPKEPIGVGEEGEILVVFNSKGKHGNQTKTVTITANTDPPQSIIYIKGEVLADESAKTKKPKVAQ
ncbi:MAG TPA: DUF1573 domain-containing protein [Bacteroidetes bacterium]|nr:DUF1573 domain-containing protein [Bacteroidota bacterium]